MNDPKRSKIEPVHLEEAAKLKALYEERNVGPSKLSQGAFGAEHGIGSQGMVWQYLNGKSALNLEAALKFAQALKCEVADFSPRLAETLPPLVRYELPPDYPASPAVAGSPESTAETLPIPSDDDYALIPQYSARAACGPAYHNGHVEVRGGLAFKRDWLARMGLRPENLSVIAANGESMAPTIHDGEVLLIDHSDTEPRDGKVFALARGDEMVVKRLARDFAGGWIVRSDNSDKARFGDFHVSDAAIRIVGRVVWRGGGL